MYVVTERSMRRLAPTKSYLPSRRICVRTNGGTDTEQKCDLYMYVVTERSMRRLAPTKSYLHVYVAWLTFNVNSFMA